VTVSLRLLASFVIAAFALAVTLLVATGALVSKNELGPTPSTSTASPSISPAAPSGATIRSPSPAASPPPAATFAASASIPAIDGIRCEPLERIDYHVHAHLTIRVRGEEHVVPSQIGFRASCLFWLHTHTASGILHIEAPTQRAFTLGEFFDIWGEALGPAEVGSEIVETGESVYAFVDGEPWAADPRDIPLRAHTVIDLQLGQTPLPPLEYAFPAGL
jgi:hypothetical protein